MSENKSEASAPVWCWHDLMTTDVKAASAFYSELFGWQIQAVPIGDGTYDMINAGECGIGGIMPLDAADGIPSHWTGYVMNDDVDAAAARADANGGSVHVPPNDIPGVGRFAVLADPAGASFAVFKSAGPKQGSTPNPASPGVFCWNELMTSDVPGAKAFYAEVLGWKCRDIDMGQTGTYSLFFTGDEAAPTDSGGMMENPSDAPHPPHWMHYVTVKNVDETFGRIADLGGQPFVPPTDIPGIGRFAVAADPTGAAFALYASAST